MSTPPDRIAVLAGVLATVVVVGAILWFLVPARRIVLRGSWAALRDQLDMLLHGRPRPRFLVVELVPGERYVRLVRERAGLVLEFPVATLPHQRRERRLRALCAARGMQLREQHGRRGARTVRVTMPETLDELAESTGALLADVLDAAPETEFRMTLQV